MNRLVGKVAIVAGGAGGVGAAIVSQFLAEGASVLIADTPGVEVIGLSEMLGEYPDRVKFHATNLTAEASLAAACCAARLQWGKVNVAVVGAEPRGTAALLHMKESDWDSVMQGTIGSAFLLTKHVIPLIVEAGGGSVIAISSTLAMNGIPGKTAQAAASGAIRAFVKAVACEWVNDAVRINSIHPRAIDDAGRTALSASVPCAAGDIAWGCVFLASEEARFISGAELVIDGGVSSA